MFPPPPTATRVGAALRAAAPSLLLLGALVVRPADPGVVPAADTPDPARASIAARESDARLQGHGLQGHGLQGHGLQGLGLQDRGLLGLGLLGLGLQGPGLQGAVQQVAAQQVAAQQGAAQQGAVRPGAAQALPGGPPPSPPPLVAAPTLLFAVDGTVGTGDGGHVVGVGPTVLGTLFGANVARFAPGRDAHAVKHLATPEVVAVHGDLDGDGDLWEVHWGEIDALGLRRIGLPIARPTVADLVFSTRDDWGEEEYWSALDAPGAFDGTLFSLARTTDGHDFVANRFLSERLVVEAIGQAGDPLSDGVDVDAFTQDYDANVYLSFRDEEWVGGWPLHPAGVVCLPRIALTYAADGDVADVAPGCARIVLDQAMVDGFVVAAGVHRPSGWTVTSLGDLQALEIDPAGGVFPPWEPVPGLPAGVPHLLFAGEKIGPTVLSTRGGGSHALLDGHPLGADPMSAAALGLDPDADPTVRDLNALLLVAAGLPTPVLDVTWPEIELASAPRLELVGGGLSPGFPVAAVLALGPAVAGAGLHSLPADPDLWYPQVYVADPIAIVVSVADAGGRVLFGFDVASPPDQDLWLVAQLYDLARATLSPPATVWCPVVP